MKKEHLDCPGMLWQTMDVLELGFQNKSFDVVIDKCTLDSILKTKTPNYQVSVALKEIQRVLVEGGIYLCISYANPCK